MAFLFFLLLFEGFSLYSDNFICLIASLRSGKWWVQWVLVFGGASLGKMGRATGEWGVGCAGTICLANVSNPNSVSVWCQGECDNGYTSLSFITIKHLSRFHTDDYVIEEKILIWILEVPEQLATKSKSPYGFRASQRIQFFPIWGPIFREENKFIDQGILLLKEKE